MDKSSKGIRGGRRCAVLLNTAALATAAAWSALALASPANAQVFDKHLAMDCPKPYSQQCLGHPGIVVHTNGPLYAKFTADGNPPSCAPGDAAILFNDWPGNHAVVQPGESVELAQNRGDSEDVYVEVQMTGVLGGCNTGAMSGWSGNLHVETDDDAARYVGQPIPLDRPPSKPPYVRQ
ncbi:hypothetical protein K3U94_21765 [Mycolicibacter heraklionensis]|uniref:Lipoprotein n=1 Tax=Mycolicibacter heraklionensis TaxID=512402 RepID=A0A9X7ZG49_9MYCO|nr:hypothetical protein [Mycolicibacter heraklionensis]QZA07520.1 hypothetical protein K3U94_21765 [Mycolicibacter heraklionensis]